jgi:hypothetical protein
MTWNYLRRRRGPGRTSYARLDWNWIRDSSRLSCWACANWLTSQGANRRPLGLRAPNRSRMDAKPPRYCRNRSVRLLSRSVRLRRRRNATGRLPWPPELHWPCFQQRRDSRRKSCRLPWARRCVHRNRSARRERHHESRRRNRRGLRRERYSVRHHHHRRRGHHRRHRRENHHRHHHRGNRHRRHHGRRHRVAQRQDLGRKKVQTLQGM